MKKLPRSLAGLLKRTLAPMVVPALLMSLSSCSSLSSMMSSKSSNLKNDRVTYSFIDTTGSYQLVREIGVMGEEKNKEVFVKTKLLPENGDDNKALEKSIVISNFGQMKTKEGHIKVLRPKISQYTAWFDGEKFFSQIKANLQTKKLEVILVSPEKKWQGKSYFDMPDGESVYCFYSQLSECVKITDFLKLSAKKKAGKMSFKLIWDKYPYLQEHFANIRPEVISDASFIYDGETKEGIYKFVLKVSGHSIFYHFDKEFNFVKNFWVAQGISQVKL